MLRNDAAYLDALGTRAIPDPATAGDFCRRFSDDDVGTLMGIINDVRLNVWRERGAAEVIDDALDLCRCAGFERVLVRGDTAFSTGSAEELR